MPNVALYAARHPRSMCPSPVMMLFIAPPARTVANHRPSTYSSPPYGLNGLHGEAPAFLSPIRVHAHGLIPADPALEQEFCIYDAWGKAGPRLYLAERPPGVNERTPVLYFFFLHLLCKIVCLLFRPSALVASLCLIVLVVGSFFRSYD